jgi:hypothetical protein
VHRQPPQGSTSNGTPDDSALVLRARLARHGGERLSAYGTARDARASSMRCHALVTHTSTSPRLRADAHPRPHMRDISAPGCRQPSTRPLRSSFRAPGHRHRTTVRTDHRRVRGTLAKERPHRALPCQLQPEQRALRCRCSLVDRLRSPSSPQPGRHSTKVLAACSSVEHTSPLPTRRSQDRTPHP